MLNWLVIFIIFSAVSIIPSSSGMNLSIWSLQQLKEMKDNKEQLMLFDESYKCVTRILKSYADSSATTMIYFTWIGILSIIFGIASKLCLSNLALLAGLCITLAIMVDGYKFSDARASYYKELQKLSADEKYRPILESFTAHGTFVKIMINHTLRRHKPAETTEIQPPP